MEIENGGSILDRATRRLGSAVLLGLAFGVAACGPGDEPGDILVCGPGTEAKNGVCVAIVDPIASCGEGTEFDEDTGACEPTVRCADGTKVNDAGECVPVAICGPGTALDLATGRCLPVASCGPGTVLDDATGRCVSSASCGAGTDLVDGECVAVGVCAPGTVLNMDNGLCESHLECGAGQVISGGVCVSPNDAVGLEADAREPGIDNNDPGYGGTPEPLTLEPIGEQTVFVGNISRPTDFAGNGVLAQDRDVWAFDGVAGQYLRISLLGTGLPQPAFILEGPRGYTRGSSLLSTQNTVREVVLPYTGRYELMVVPTAYLTTGVPVGGANAGYVGVIEELEKPTPTPLVPGASQDSPTEVSGNLHDLSDNFFLLQGEPGDAVSLVFQDVSDTMPPAILAFDSSGALITHADVDLSFGDWVGTLVKEAGTTIVVDWQSSTTSADAFKLAAARVPNAGTIAVAPNAKGEAAPVAIPPSQLVAYTITNSAPLVLNWTTWRSGALSGPDVQVLPASGQTVLMPDRANAATALYAEPDSVRTVFVYNDTTSENDAIFIWDGEPVTDLGTLDPVTGDSVDRGGALLTPDVFGPRGEWMVARLSTPGLLKLHPDLAAGDAELFYYSFWGVELHEHPLPDQATPTHYIVEEDPILVRIQATNSMVALDWSLQAEALPHPLTHLDQEPNDTLEEAVPVGDLPVRFIGYLEDNSAVDVYQIDVPEPIDAGEAIVVHIENLDTIANGTASDAAIFTIRDEDGEILPTAQLASVSSLSHANRVTYYIDSTATQSSSKFFIHLQNRSSGFKPEHRYLVDISVVAGTFEVEPNNELAEADEATVFPVTWEAHWERLDDLDVFAFTLDEDMPSDKLLELRFHASSNGATIQLLREDESEVMNGGSTSSANTRMSVGGLAAGRYYITVKGSTSGTFRYSIGAALIDMPLLEVEPNNDATEAQSLGELAQVPVYVFGQATSTEVDWFKVSMSTPLAAGESVRVRCLALSGSGTPICEVYDLSDPADPALLGFSRQNYAAGLEVNTDATELGVRVNNSSSSVRGYALLIERVGSTAEKEPNNDAASADPLGELTAAGMLFQTGNITLGDDDWFSFTISEDFAQSGQGIWAFVDNRYNNSAFELTLYDVSDPAAPIELNRMRTARGAVFSAPVNGVTEYAVKVTLPSGTGSFVYDLTVEPGPSAELEPNDTIETANDLGALPASVYGITTYSAPDFFKFTLPDDLSETQLVEVVYQTIGSATGFTVELSHAGTQVDSSGGNLAHSVLHTAPGASAGTYEIQISRTGSTSSTYHYRLDVNVVEIAPNP